jgi:hypothetical protein
MTVFILCLVSNSFIQKLICGADYDRNKCTFLFGGELDKGHSDALVAAK